MEAKTIAQLKLDIGKAAIEGDDAAFNAAISAYNKALKSDKEAQAAIKKAELDAIAKENEALAGKRQELGTEIYKAVKALNFKAKLEALKAQGFTFKLDAPDANGVMVVHKSVALLVPVAKAKRQAGERNGEVTTSEDMYGLKLDAIYDKYHNAEDADKITAIDADVKAGKLETKAANSKKWVVKKSVRERAVAEGLLKPLS